MKIEILWHQVLVRSNSLMQPFENVLSVTLGDTFDPTTIVALLTDAYPCCLCVGDIGVGALLIVLGFLFTIKKPNKFGGMLKRLGAAVLIGGLI